MKAPASSTGGLELPTSDRPALVYGDERLTWAELSDQVDSLAGALAARGLGDGAPVALVLPNVPALDRKSVV